MARTLGTASWLTLLPEDLIIFILALLNDYSDCARFCLASPRIGLLALRKPLLTFKHPLFSVALSIETTKIAIGPMFNLGFTNMMLRKYASDSKATSESFAWIKRVSPQLYLTEELSGPNGCLPRSTTIDSKWWYLDTPKVCYNDNRKTLCQLDRTLVARIDAFSGRVHKTHFDGERGVERMLRMQSEPGTIYFEGEHGIEHVVRLELKNNVVKHFEGTRNNEHIVRVVHADKHVRHYEGERFNERIVRIELPNGKVKHYEGESGYERLTRTTFDDNDSRRECYYEGEKNYERLVRGVFKNGNVNIYEGTRGCERIVRSEVPAPKHFTGERSAEQIIC